MSLAKSGSIIVQQDLLLTDSVQQITVEPSSAMNSGGPNGRAQKATSPFYLVEQTSLQLRWN